MMKIAIGCDPNAQKEKEEIIEYIEKRVMVKLPILGVKMLSMLMLQ